MSNQNDAVKDVKTVSNVDIVSISSSAMLVDLSIRSWTGTKIDRVTSNEIDIAKETQVSGGKYQKNLFAGTNDLHDINKFDSRIRAWNIGQTLPWSDKGQRLLPSAKFFDYKKGISTYEGIRQDMILKFLDRYDILIDESSVALGKLFDRNNYPSIQQVTGQFEFSYSFLPVPTMGDFRVDIGNDAVAELQEQFTRSVNGRIGDAMNDVSLRLQDCLTRMSDRLADSDDNAGASSKKKIFRDTLITNAQELCEALRHMNLTKDPKIEEARKQLSKVVSGVDAETLRDSEHARKEVKAEVDDILSKFNW
jgi:hypothetical protein